MDTDVTTDTTLTSDEALAALDRANTPPPPPIDPAVAERRRLALQVIEAFLREDNFLPEVEAWFATRPLERVCQALGVARGEPLAGAFRPVRLVDNLIIAATPLLMAPRRDRLAQLAAELQTADDTGGIERLQAEVQRVAGEVRHARAAVEPWRRNVRRVEDEVRQMVTSLQAWLEDCERARRENTVHDD
jgi:hypothetical protein